MNAAASLQCRFSENKMKINKKKKITCSTFASQSIEFDSAEERINLHRPNIATNDIAKILPRNKSNNADKFHLLKNAFRPVEDPAMAFDFKEM